MGKKSVNVKPKTEAILIKMGEQIKLARLRRNLSCDELAMKANISRATLWHVEKGSPSVAIGIYASVLYALNDMDDDLLLIAREDCFGRNLQDQKLLRRV